jgi:hypothetical protein
MEIHVLSNPLFNRDEVALEATIRAFTTIPALHPRTYFSFKLLQVISETALEEERRLFAVAVKEIDNARQITTTRTIQ